MQQYLPLAQIIISVFLVVFILLQQRGTALGSAFGQEGGFYATRRGIQKKILWATIVCGVLFILLALLNLIL
ncbi:MAG: preprotein translocase subunit SecG [Candidatus Nealsonbacteria bacterium CG02_land_8_20_14_3_00_37_10]|uniref:Protein-export membrane protein SecG n=2 Tax=Candidatus Nealsoniibacteriota TaxID=1817911 RepID=A0A2G9YZC7_9BACT|nr:MAG: preprotein translocase subunit SecG [Candidatus Nealsonbacteria bacterium CG23_combo_of_CG06-09_8_20_14_all_37_18]PIV45099.1 MAG: preprotein translocase subunit SecG [Candidatus Nealsonbacteria bacterium CG02_land_8_20_14_3_00_37_10]